MRSPSVTTMSEQGRLFVRHPPVQADEPGHGSADETAPRHRRWDFQLPLLLGREAREERAQAREQQKELMSIEAAKQAFFETPAGKARLAYKRGHRLFQYELETTALSPIVIPGYVGSPARETTDPVDILNSVTFEGWKLVTGKFFHSDLRNGVVGCYLFKRSQKRRMSMNNPWQNLDPVR
jgi:hypothetical protein